MPKELNTYSYSKITHFYDCPYSFYKHYFDEEVGIGAGVSEFGGFMHTIMEKYEKGELKIKDMPSYYIQNYNDNIHSSFELLLNPEFSKNFADFYYEKGLKYLVNFKGFTNWKILNVEHEFNININDKFILTGKIDLVALDKDGKLLICDHKSKTKFKSKKELKDYSKQLYAYSYPTYLLYNKYPDYLVFNLFSETGQEIIPFNEEDYKMTMDWLERSVDEIESAFDFPTNYGTFYCRNFCAYRKKCYPECKYND